MRVIAGKARSMPLAAPKGDGTRPTTDRIKETLFNTMQAYVSDAVFIDLFAGSGAVGIEALSRGAKKAYFVDNNREALDCIRKNLEFTKLDDKATVIGRNAVDALYEIKDSADIIFIDPPYHLGIESDIMRMIRDRGLAHEDTLIVIEADIDTDLSGIESLGYSVFKEKLYKTNKHIFYRVDEA